MALTTVKCSEFFNCVSEIFQGTFFKLFRHSKFQLSIIFTFKVIAIDSVISVKLSDFPGYLYIYKVGAFFDLLGRTPPRPSALEG